jgi:hypothetical protein
MAEIRVNVKGETCPVPLVETRKALPEAFAVFRAFQCPSVLTLS